MSNPFLESQKNQPWAIDSAALDNFINQVNLLPVNAVIDVQMKAPVPAMTIRGRIATIPIQGTLLKEVPAWLRFFGIKATSYTDIRQQVHEAVNHPDVEQIHLHIESPGGTVAGCQETAEVIAAAAQSKPVTAVIEDLCCSAAYYLASQAKTIAANQDAWVGSIGTYMYLYDYSKMADDAGIKTVLISSGPHKGTGVPGTKITDQQIAAIQEIIDAHAGHFKAAVRAGRGFSEKTINTLSTGQTWIATKAKELGLIDDIINSKQNSNLGDKQMSEQNTETTTAAIDVEQAKADAAQQADAANKQRLADLKAAFPQDLAFAVEQFEKGNTVAQAKADYCDVLAKQNAELAEQLEKQKQASAGETVDGAEPIAHGGDGNDGGDGNGDFVAQAAALARDKNMKLADAMSQLASEQPALYNAYLDKCRRRQVKDTD